MPSFAAGCYSDLPASIQMGVLVCTRILSGPKLLKQQNYYSQHLYFFLQLIGQNCKYNYSTQVLRTYQIKLQWLINYFMMTKFEIIYALPASTPQKPLCLCPLPLCCFGLIDLLSASPSRLCRSFALLQFCTCKSQVKRWGA